MKNVKLMAIAALTVFIGSNCHGNVSDWRDFLGDDSKVGIACRPNPLVPFKLDVSCETLGQFLTRAKEHYKKQAEIKNIENELKKATNADAKEALAEKLQEIKEAHPSYQSDFVDSLNQEDLKKLREAKKAILKTIPPYAVNEESKLVDKVLRNEK